MADRLSQEDKDWIMALPEGEREIVMEALLTFPTAVFVDKPPTPEPEQLRLGESPEVTRVREEAIERADRPPSDEWKRHAHAVIERTARSLPLLTSEDVWASGLRRPDNGSPDGDALGPAMRRARTAGFIEPTGETTTRTNRPQRHNNPKRIWRSLIYGKSR